MGSCKELLDERDIVSSSLSSSSVNKSGSIVSGDRRHGAVVSVAAAATTAQEVVTLRQQLDLLLCLALRIGMTIPARFYDVYQAILVKLKCVELKRIFCCGDIFITIRKRFGACGMCEMLDDVSLIDDDVTCCRVPTSKRQSPTAAWQATTSSV